MRNKKFQEEQDSIRRTQEKQSTGKEELFDPKRNNPVTYENARKTIFEWIKQGRNYREMMQTPFNIIGWDKPKRFALSEISRIKQSHDVTNQPDGNSDIIDEKKAEIFELLDKNWQPRKIVIKLKTSPAFVKETTLEYLELDNYSPQIIKELVDISKGFNYTIENSDQLKTLFSDALNSHDLWTSVFYYCVRCRKPVYFTPEKNESWFEDMVDALNYLGKNHWHPNCVS